MTDTIKEFTTAYNTLREKYNLPSLDEFNHHFAISDFYQECVPKMLANSLRMFLQTEVQKCCSYLQSLLSADPILGKYTLDEGQRSQLLRIIKELHTCSQEAVLLHLDKDEKKDAEFISKWLNYWKETKPIIRKILQANMDVWDSSSSDVDSTPKQYMG